MSDSTNLRAELRGYARIRFAAFTVGTVALFLYMQALGILRVAIISAFGELVFLWIFGVGMFAAFLAPIVLAEYMQLQNLRLHCPNCGQFLAGIRATLRINKCDECVYCKTKLDVQKATRWQSVLDLLVTLGGMAVLILFMSWLS